MVMVVGIQRSHAQKMTVKDDAGNVLMQVNDEGAQGSIMLPADTYRCSISCPAWTANAHKARLQNITAGTSLLLGTVEFSVDLPTRSWIKGRFTLAVESTLEIQHRCRVSVAPFGYGKAAAGFGDDEIYTMAEFWREK